VSFEPRGDHVELGAAGDDRVDQEGLLLLGEKAPFGAAWAEVEARLRDTPALEAKALFEMLRIEAPARFADG